MSILPSRTWYQPAVGIAPASVPAFVAAQLAGGAVAYGVIRVLYPDVTPAEAADVVVPHADETVEHLHL